MKINGDWLCGDWKMTIPIFEDYIEDEINEAGEDDKNIAGIFNWIIRFIVSFSLLVGLAFILKYTLIEPYSYQMLELPIEFNYEPAAKKGECSASLSEWLWRINEQSQ